MAALTAPPRFLLAALTVRARLAGLAACLGVAGVVAAQTAGTGHTAGIECRADESEGQVCAVDRPLYIGYRVYTRHCASCHGAAAEGSTFAPDLRRRLQQFDEARFAAAMRNGYTGPMAPLEPWANRREVAAQLELLWAYLEARASGRLPDARIEVGPARSHAGPPLRPQ